MGFLEDESAGVITGILMHSPNSQKTMLPVMLKPKLK